MDTLSAGRVGALERSDERAERFVRSDAAECVGRCSRRVDVALTKGNSREDGHGPRVADDADGLEEADAERRPRGGREIGGRVALAILSVLDATELSQAIARQDKAMVARANGVGPKLAERIVRELKDKVGGIAIGPTGVAIAAPSGAAADAVSALGNLGFRPAEASTAVAAAVDELGESAGLDALVRLALRKVAR